MLAWPQCGIDIFLPWWVFLYMSSTFETKRRLESSRRGLFFSLMHLKSYWFCWFRDCTYWDMVSRTPCPSWVWCKGQLVSSMPALGWARPASLFCQQSIPMLGPFKKSFLSEFMWNIERVVRAFHEFVFFVVQFSSVQLLSHVRLFATPWAAARQAFLSITNSWSPLKLTSIVSVMPSNHLILCRPLLLPSIFPSIRVFSSESVLHIRWPKY